MWNEYEDKWHVNPFPPTLHIIHIPCLRFRSLSASVPFFLRVWGTFSSNRAASSVSILCTQYIFFQTRTQEKLLTAPSASRRRGETTWSTIYFIKAPAFSQFFFPLLHQYVNAAWCRWVSIAPFKALIFSERNQSLVSFKRLFGSLEQCLSTTQILWDHVRCAVNNDPIAPNWCKKITFYSGVIGPSKESNPFFFSSSKYISLVCF